MNEPLGPVRDARVIGYEAGKVLIEERVRTGPGMPFVAVAHSPEEDAKNRRMSALLAQMDDIVVAECGVKRLPQPTRTAVEQALGELEAHVLRRMATLTSPRGSMGEETDAADQAEVERINLAPRPYRDAVRLSPFGSEPWDHAAGEAS